MSAADYPKIKKPFVTLEFLWLNDGALAVVHKQRDENTEGASRYTIRIYFDAPLLIFYI